MYLLPHAQLAAEYGLMFMEVNAKTGHNVERVSITTDVYWQLGKETLYRALQKYDDRTICMPCLTF